jgi:hypothetical protein
VICMARLPKSIIKKYGISKKAWAVFRGRRKGKTRSTRSRRASSSKRSVRKTARRYYRKKRRGRGKSILQTAYKLIPVAALAAPAISDFMSQPTTEGKVEKIIAHYTGYSIQKRDFRFERMVEGWSPFVASVLIIKGVQKIRGILNRI